MGSTISKVGDFVALNGVVLDEESMYIAYTLTVPEKWRQKKMKYLTMMI